MLHFPPHCVWQGMALFALNRWTTALSSLLSAPPPAAVTVPPSDPARPGFSDASSFEASSAKVALRAETPAAVSASPAPTDADALRAQATRDAQSVADAYESGGPLAAAQRLDALTEAASVRPGGKIYADALMLASQPTVAQISADLSARIQGNIDDSESDPTTEGTVEALAKVASRANVNGVAVLGMALAAALPDDASFGDGLNQFDDAFRALGEGGVVLAQAVVNELRAACKSSSLGDMAEIATPNADPVGIRPTWVAPTQGEWTTDSGGSLSDPINVYLHGTRAQVEGQLEAGGWIRAADNTLGNKIKFGGAVVADLIPGPNPFHGSVDSMPMSDLRFDGRGADMSYEQGNDARDGTRHHIRVYDTGTVDANGEPVWAVAASYDEGQEFRRDRPDQFFINHFTELNTDIERDFVLQTIQNEGAVQSVTVLPVDYGPRPENELQSKDQTALDVTLAP